MARTRKKDDEVETSPGSGPSMTATVKGAPDEVKRHLGVGDNKNTPPLSSEKTFQEAIKDPKNGVVVHRISPRKLNGQKINVEVYRERCPLTLNQIEEEVFNEHGGRDFRISVVESEGGETIAATVRTNAADPIIPEKIESVDESFLRDIETEPDAGEEAEKALQLRIRMAGLRKDLDAAEGRGAQRENGNDDSDQIKRLEKKILEMQEESKFDRMQREHREEIRTLTDKMEKLAVPKEDTGNKVVEMLVKQMEENRKSTNEQMTRMMDQMKDDKLGAIEQKLIAIDNKPTTKDGGMLESIEMLTKVLGLIGVDLPGAGKEDAPDEREWYEKLMDDHLPKILDAITTEKEAGGPPISKEDLAKRIGDAADAAIAEQKAELQARQTAPPRKIQHEIDAPAAKPGPAPVPVVEPPAYGPPPTTPPPAPQPPVAATAPPAEAPTTAPQMPSVAEEISRRCSQVLVVMTREMDVRPRDFKWTFIAWDHLPEMIREKLAKAKDPASMFDAFIQYANPEGLKTLKEKVGSDAKLNLWFARGLKEISEWQTKLDADPNFEPNTEEDDPGEEETAAPEGEPQP